ncbi:hotdog fold domain-containing protein [Streptomyces sp. NPDC019396]|uniref:PaaI family thioesterase n=1 Tax=Streptomyces sp. NPDC019396 TaxID=3154687 RepID=UPI0034113C67
MTTDVIVVPPLYSGYPGVAFGGYVAGVLAQRSGAKAVRVDFRGPVPLGSGVRIAVTGGGGAELGESVKPLATAVPVDGVSLDVPEAPSWDEALAAAEAYRADPPPGSVDCFGCGPDRTPERGLRQHCAPVPGRDLVATAWVPSPALAGDDGTLPAELVWGALDCPGNAAGRALGTQQAGSVTAALTGTLLRPVTAGERYISYAWLLSESGRKHTMAVAVSTANGELCAVSQALWLDPRGAATGA